MYLVITAIAGVIVGGVLGFVLWQVFVSKKSKGAKVRAERIIDEARSKEKELLLQAKDEALKSKDEAEICECGTRFWIYWHKRPRKMTMCAPCFFKKKKK